MEKHRGNTGPPLRDALFRYRKIKNRVTASSPDATSIDEIEAQFANQVELPRSENAETAPKETDHSSGVRMGSRGFDWAQSGRLRGMFWENYQVGELLIARSIWNGIAADPKSRMSKAAIQ
jgi:hypothetical protein